MEEIVIRVDAPPELRAKLKLALSKVAKELIEESKHSPEQSEEELIKRSIEIGRKINKSLHNRYKILYPELK